MRVLILGPLEVVGEDGRPIAIAGAKERAVLAALAVRAGRVVSSDELADVLWEADPPRTAARTLRSYVSRLRRVLGTDGGSGRELLQAVGAGYRLAVAPDGVDSIEFERLAHEGRDLHREGHSAEAVTVLQRALDLWRGSAFQDFRDAAFVTTEAERLDELRRATLEDRMDASLASADPGPLVADAEAMVTEEPLRERRWAQLMLALYRAGRQAEALHAFNRARSNLVEELGIEPGSELRDLQSAILAQDRALDVTSPAPLESTTDVCPYKGLARFEASDAGFYFGRERVVADAVARLVAGRFLAIVGASGSGKSSLIRAGVFHALLSGAIPGSVNWRHAVMRPGEHPLASLRNAIDTALVGDAATPDRFVVGIDQFEETFTACGDEAERSAFLDRITEMATVPEGSASVVLAMRSDFYGRCAEHEALASLVADHQILLRPMDGSDLARTIELPARRAGLEVEERLTRTLVEHSVGQPGALPLLSTALLELWTHRRDRTLRLDDYVATGGVEGAVARIAEDVFGRLDASGRVAAKRILLRLAAHGEGSEVVRRSARLAEFDLDRDPNAARALAMLTAGRLIIVADDAAEVAHEALLRDWPRLRGWLDEDAEFQWQHRRVTAASLAWEEGGRDDGDVFRGARLTAALDWAADHGDDLNDVERSFLDAGRRASEQQIERSRRTNRQLRALLVGVGSLLVVSLIVGSLALRQRDVAREMARIADARQLASGSRVERDGVLALLLARESVALNDSPTTRSALLSALLRQPAAIHELHADVAVPGDLSEWLSLSTDGRFIASGGAQRVVDIFDGIDYRKVATIQTDAPTTAGDFSPDDSSLVVATDGGLALIDVAKRSMAATVLTEARVDAIRFSPDGRSIVSAEASPLGGTLVRRDPDTLEPLEKPIPVEEGPVKAMAFAPDGRLLTTSLPTDPTETGLTTLRQRSNLAPIRRFRVSGNDVAISPDGHLAAIAGPGSSEDGRLEGHLVLLDLRTGERTVSRQGLARGDWGNPLGITGVAFAPDGEVVSTGADHRVIRWGPEATVDEAFVDPSDLVVRAPAVTPDGGTAFTIDVDGNIAVWDLTGERRIGRPFVAGSGAEIWGPWFAVSPDGTTIAITQVHGMHGSVRLLDTTTMQSRVIPYNRYGEIWPQGIAFSPDGHTLAVTAYKGYVQLWDVATATPDGPPFPIPPGPKMDLWAMPTFSPDGSMLAVGGAIHRSDPHPRGVAFLWDIAKREVVAELPTRGYAVNALNFTPDGKRLVISTGITGGGAAIVWSVYRQHVERTIHADRSGIYAADVSNDGAVLATGGESNREWLWNLRTGKPIGPAIVGPVTTVDLSPDGRMLVGASTGQVVVWDVSTRTALVRSFPGVGSVASGDQLAASFTPDGRRLLIVASSGRAWTWDMDVGSWKRRACDIAGRNLTLAEWRQALPDRPYAPVCSSSSMSL